MKCEKFYIGFDIGGWKLFKFQWGETEYGIGVLPLGGYVKMLGQEDNPARVAEELERAKRRPAKTGGGEAVKLDPRSYLAQSVPERMAIISAGVIMNVIFAFVFASIAYAMGVEYTPCVIGGVLPGEAAWQAGLQPGDESPEDQRHANRRASRICRRASRWATWRMACRWWFGAPASVSRSRSWFIPSGRPTRRLRGSARDRSTPTGCTIN